MFGLLFPQAVISQKSACIILGSYHCRQSTGVDYMAGFINSKNSCTVNIIFSFILRIAVRPAIEKDSTLICWEGLGVKLGPVKLVCKMQNYLYLYLPLPYREILHRPPTPPLFFLQLQIEH